MNRFGPLRARRRLRGAGPAAPLLGVAILLAGLGAFPAAALGAGRSAAPATGPAGAPDGSSGPSAMAPVGPAWPAPARAWPSGPPVFGVAQYSGHYYAGAMYDGTNTTSTSLAADIAVPRDVPDPGDFYYVIVSAWDDGSSYDQLGFTSGGGVWGVAYSTTTPCAGSYTFSTDAYNLTPGLTYRFAMSLSGGVVLFEVAPVGGSDLWTHSAVTGGIHFWVADSYSCDSVSSFDYTDYEEVYTTTGPTPPYPFVFTNNSAGSQPVTAWGPFTLSAPGEIGMAISGPDVTIENEPFDLVVPPTIEGELAGATKNYSTNVTVGAYSGSGSVTLSIGGTIPNASLILRPSSGSYPGSATLDLQVTNRTAAGSYEVEVKAVSPSGDFARLRVDVVIVGPLIASTPALSPPAADVNQSVTIEEVPEGGTGTFAFAWSGLPTGCPVAGYRVQCVVRSAGEFPVTVLVTDSLGFRSTSPQRLLNVSPEMVLFPTATRAAADLGQVLAFGASVAGGAGGFAYAWTASPAAACTAQGANFSCTPYATGTLTVGVTVTDRNGASVRSSPFQAFISTDPTVNLTLRPKAIEVGGTVRLAAEASGGSGGYSITFVGVPADCTRPTNASAVCTAAEQGVYRITAVVNDSNGDSQESATSVLTVYPAIAVTLAESASTVLAGDPLTLSADGSGGSGRYAFAWSGLPADCPSGSDRAVSCASATPGTYQVFVHISDDAGGNATASISFTVVPSLLGLPETEGLAVLGLGLGALALGAVVLIVRLRRRRRA
ncbi:MAG TPA: hypothetical protein VLY85_03080 [Thermoplasmata archaeon]|nr:hypothetical protein [Thermoplasmata archaeon]